MIQPVIMSRILTLRLCATLRLPAILAVAFGSILPGAAGAQHDSSHHSRYPEYQSREIKALSPDEIESLHSGEGMGMALAAELNGFPGPRHVMELADELDLTQTQAQEVEHIFEAMNKHAIALGRHVVHLEKRLDHEFIQQSITPGELDSLALEIASFRGRLRAVHLRAHVQTFGLLTEPQRALYGRLRGYNDH